MRFAVHALLLTVAVCPFVGGNDSASHQRVKRWTIEDFDPLLFVGLEGNRDFENGRRVFAEASCTKCHRLAGGGTANGPDLGKAVKRMGPRELLEAVLSPDLAVAQSEAVRRFDLGGGRSLSGRVVGVSERQYRINTDPFDPRKVTVVERSAIRAEESLAESAMPRGLVDAFDDEDVLDLLAYLLSGGEEGNAMFVE